MADIHYKKNTNNKYTVLGDNYNQNKLCMHSTKNTSNMWSFLSLSWIFSFVPKRDLFVSNWDLLVSIIWIFSMSLLHIYVSQNGIFWSTWQFRGMIRHIWYIKFCNNSSACYLKDLGLILFEFQKLSLSIWTHIMLYQHLLDIKLTIIYVQDSFD